MKQMISVITLGVGSLEKSRAFYERALGWTPSRTGEPVTYSTPTVILSLFPRARLAEDATVPEEGTGFSGVTLAYCARSEEEVRSTMAQADAAGGRIVKAAGPVFWGGYSGYFADPDGHLWEVAFHSAWEFDDDGRIRAL